MRVGFFVPCYVDALAPEAAKATFRLIRRFERDVTFIDRASCCGLPFTDMGYDKHACKIERDFVKYFGDYDVIVTSSGICTDQIRHHLDSVEQTDAVRHLRENTHDIVEFLHDIIQVDSLPWAEFPHRVGLHNGCHALRFLHQARPTELIIPDYSKTEYLLSLVKGLEIAYADRRDECCGFGGAFTVWDEECSRQMGLDKVTDYARNGIRYVTSADFSCLLHQECIARKFGIDLKTFYIAEILNGDAKP